MGNYSFEHRVFDIIDSFSFFNGSVLELSRGIFMNSGMEHNTYPTNAALTCIGVAFEELTGSPVISRWAEIVTHFHNSSHRKRKPMRGNKLYDNTTERMDNLREMVEMDKERISMEVTMSGSKIGN